MLHYWKIAFPVLLRALCPFLTTAAAKAPQIPALLGVNLGSTHLTAATINGSGTFPLAFIAGSQGYIDFMKNTTNAQLHLEDYYDEAFGFMKEAIDDVRIKASQSNSKDIRIGAILAPQHFTYEMRLLVFYSWHAVNDGVLGQPVRPVSFSAIVYPGNDCVDRLYNPALSWDQGEWILTFHQDFNSLSVSLSMVTTYMYETTSRNIAMPASVDDIINFLRFADDYEDHPKITSVVLSSLDGNANFQVVREALDKFDVQLWQRRKKSSLELKYMAAAGAACLARQYAVFPEEDGCSYPLVDEEEITSPFLHVEL